MTVIICPGVHDPALSNCFVAALGHALESSWTGSSGGTPYGLLPTQRYAPFNGGSVWSFLQQWADPTVPVLLIGFSAGAVGATAAAQLWQAQGRAVAALIALDGWGVPQWGDFPLHRLSHDSFTHWSSAWLGAGQAGFYADPSVAHLELWRSPHTVQGWEFAAGDHGRRTTAIAFLAQLLQHYGYRGPLQPVLTPAAVPSQPDRRYESARHPETAE